MNTLTLAGGGFVMGNDSMRLATEAVLLLAAEQSRNAESVPTLAANGAIQGAGVNLSRIGFGDLTLGGASMFAAPMKVDDGVLVVPVNLKGTRAGNFPPTDFTTSSIGAAARVSPRLERVKFNEDGGVARVGNQGAKKIVKISVRNSAKPATADGALLDLGTALKLQDGTGPSLAQNADERLPLSDTVSIKTDANNVTLGGANIVPVIHQDEGRQYTTVRLVSLLSPPVAQGTYGINFHGAYRAANADVTGTLGPGPANQANWVNTSSGVDVNSGPGNWTWDANDSNGGNLISFHFVHGNAGGEDGGGGGATDFAHLFNTGERSNDGVFTITSTTTIPFNLYDIYVYGGGGYTVNTSGVTTSFAAIDGFVSGSNTWLFSGKTGPLTIKGGSINGFSIVPIPPPTAYWKGATGTTGAVWNNNPSNFTSDLAGTIPLTLQANNLANVVFNANGATNFASTTLGADLAIRTLTFSANATSAVGIGGSNTLTILPDTTTNGITVQSLSGNHTISTNVALGADQTWTVTDASQILSVSGVVSGAFKLDKAGAGTLVFSASNTYSGVTTIDAGILQLGNGGTTGALLPASGLTNNGTIVINRSNTVTQDTDFGLITGTGGFVQAGGGTAILNRANTYTGTTTVNAGTLMVFGSISGNATVNAGVLVVNGTISGTTTVNSGGILTGNNGVLANVTVNIGGTLSPGGGAIGAFTVNGDLGLNGSSIFSVQFDSTATAVDTISLNGNLNIASGAALNVTDLGANPGSIFGVPAPVITYSGTWNGGTFAGLPDDSFFTSAGQAYQISYDGGVVTLTMVAVVPEPGVAVSFLGGLGLLLGVRRRRA